AHTGGALEAGRTGRAFSGLPFARLVAGWTLGGWVSPRAAGQFSTRYGNIEDLLLALEVVLPDGQVVRTKNVPRAAAGPSLREVFCGSEGTLGIVTEGTLLILPVPERPDVASFVFADLRGGLAT